MGIDNMVVWPFEHDRAQVEEFDFSVSCVSSCVSQSNTSPSHGVDQIPIPQLDEPDVAILCQSGHTWPTRMRWIGRTHTSEALGLGKIWTFWSGLLLSPVQGLSSCCSFYLITHWTKKRLSE